MKTLIYLLAAAVLVGCSSQEKNLPESFDFGKTENGTYKNDYFNLEITFDPNWIVQDKQQMNDLVDLGSEMVAGDNESLKSVVKAAQVNTAYLLTIFKHELGAPVEYNPSFMAIAENTKNSPGIKDGSDYLFHAKKMLEQTQIQYYFDNDISEKKIGKSKFHVLEAKLDYVGKTIIQEYICTVSKGFSLSFIISYTTDAEKEELYQIIDNMKI